MKRFISLTLLALFLVTICLQAARWQYHRYEERHERNNIIRTNLKERTDEETLLSAINSPEKVAWKKISLSGRFEPSKEILVRNRYHDGYYGYGVVTLFISDNSKKYWVDRGWVRAGKDAQTPPVTQKVTSEKIAIEARVRAEKIENQLGGTLFALPGKSGSQVLERWNGSAAIETEPFYLDLLATTPNIFTPSAPTLLPEISDGPHLAYTFQWIIFALLIVLGWFLVMREDRKAQLEKA